MLERKLRCYLAGQSTLLLEGLRCLLETDFEVHVSSTEGPVALAAAAAFDPDVAVINVSSVGADLGAARLLKHFRPDLPVICLSGDDIESVPGVKWVSGFNWVKVFGCTHAMFLDIVHAACAPIARSRIQNQRRSPAPTLSTVDVTQRERQVISLIVRGLPMKEVGRVLNITARTVAFHKYNFMRKNDLGTNADLIAFCRKHRIGAGRIS